MALAYLRQADHAPGQVLFRGDTGTNRFYRYKIGAERSGVGGLEQLEQVTHVSPVFEAPNAGLWCSDFELSISASRFDRACRYIQLYTFCDREGSGPAVSNIVEVLLPVTGPEIFKDRSLSDISIQSTMSDSLFYPHRKVRFSFRENRFGRPFFLDALSKVADTLAAQTGRPLSGLFKTAERNMSRKAVEDPLPALLDRVIDRFERPESRANGIAGSFSMPFSYRNLARARTKYARNSTLGGIAGGMELAALMSSLLERSPQLVRAIGPDLSRLLGLGVQECLEERPAEESELLRLLRDWQDEKALRHLLRRLRRRGGSRVLSLPMGKSADKAGFRVAFRKEHALSVDGRQKFIYQHRGPICLLLDLVTERTLPERPIPKAQVILRVKDPASLRILFQKCFRFKEVRLGESVGLELTGEEVSALPVRQDLLVCADFCWPDREGGGRVMSDHHLIYLADQYWLKRVGEVSGPAVALSDPVKYPVFVHTIWDSRNAKACRWKVQFMVRYYLYYRPDQLSNGQIETKIRLDTDRSKVDDRRRYLVGRLKSGLELSPVELNKLLPVLGGEKELPPEKLAAFQSDEMRRYFNLAATTDLEMKGKDREYGEIWVYPEVTLREFFLSRAVANGDTGQVTAIEEECILFPIPQNLYFSGGVTE